MSTAIFLTPRSNGDGYDIQLGEDHTRLADGHANLVVFDRSGDSRMATLGEGDWEHLRDCIERLLHQTSNR